MEIRDYIYHRFFEVSEEDIKNPESPIHKYFKKREGEADLVRKKITKGTPKEQKDWAPSSSFKQSGSHRRSHRAPGGEDFLPHVDAKALDKELAVSHLAHRMSVHNPRVVYGKHTLKDYAINPKNDKDIENAYWDFIHTRSHTHRPMASDPKEKWGPEAKHTTLSHQDYDEITKEAKKRAEEMKKNREERAGTKVHKETPKAAEGAAKAAEEAPKAAEGAAKEAAASVAGKAPGFLRKHWGKVGLGAAGLAAAGAFGIHKFKQSKQKKEQDKAEQLYLAALRDYQGT